MILFPPKILFVIKETFKYVISTRQREKVASEVRIRKLQDWQIQQFDPYAKKLIVFLIPGSDRKTGIDKISGGIISIVSLCEETSLLTDTHGANVLMCTLPNEQLLWKHTQFDNNTNVFRFAQLSRFFIHSEEIIIHIPEFTCQYFLDYLPQTELRWLRAFKYVHINILNQNIRLMPTVTIINNLKKIAKLVTVTTAHQRYCNLQKRVQYGVPLHKFSVWISPEKYAFTKYDRKENILIVSPDPHPHKQPILDQLGLLPGLKIIIIQDLTYEKYKEIIASAKWALSFGEGLDAYIIESVFSGAIGFSVYNDDFFTPDFKSLDTIYSSYDELAKRMADDMQKLDDEPIFRAYQQNQFALCAKYYSLDCYRQNIKSFYESRYTFP